MSIWWRITGRRRAFWRQAVCHEKSRRRTKKNNSFLLSFQTLHMNKIRWNMGGVHKDEGGNPRNFFSRVRRENMRRYLTIQHLSSRTWCVLLVWTIFMRHSRRPKARRHLRPKILEIKLNMFGNLVNIAIRQTDKSQRPQEIKRIDDSTSKNSYILFIHRLNNKSKMPNHHLFFSPTKSFVVAQHNRPSRVRLNSQGARQEKKLIETKAFGVPHGGSWSGTTTEKRRTKFEKTWNKLLLPRQLSR